MLVPSGQNRMVTSAPDQAESMASSGSTAAAGEHKRSRHLHCRCSVIAQHVLASNAEPPRKLVSAAVLSEHLHFIKEHFKLGLFATACAAHDVAPQAVCNLAPEVLNTCRTIRTRSAGCVIQSIVAVRYHKYYGTRCKSFEGPDSADYCDIDHDGHRARSTRSFRHRSFDGNGFPQDPSQHFKHFDLQDPTVETLAV